MGLVGYYVPMYLRPLLTNCRYNFSLRHLPIKNNKMSQGLAMWIRFFILFSFSSLLNAAGLNYLGDTLDQGQQFASTSVSLSDWHFSGDFVSIANINPLDDNSRGFRGTNNNRSDFKTTLTYMYGFTSDISLGLKYGYVYQEDDASIETNDFEGLEGDWVTEGGTDLTLLGSYRLSQGTSLDLSLQLPVCSAEAISAICTSKLPVPGNSTQSGNSGGQGKGYYRLGGALSANWVTAMDTHWMGSGFAYITLADDVFGEKVSSPFTYGAKFGFIMPVKENHGWTGTLSIIRMFEYSAYSNQLQTQVNFGQHSTLAITGEYLWDFMDRLQLRPYAEFAMVQRPTEKFVTNDEERLMEFTSGTKVTLGAELRATF